MMLSLMTAMLSFIQLLTQKPDDTVAASQQASMGLHQAHKHRHAYDLLQGLLAVNWYDSACQPGFAWNAQYNIHCMAPIC